VIETTSRDVKSSKSPPKRTSGTDTDTDTAEQLRKELRELQGERNNDDLIAELVETISLEVAGDTTFTFEDDYIKSSLDELILSLIALQPGSRNGSQLRTTLTNHFDTAISPGTLYPQLNELNDEGLLIKQDGIRTKEYDINDVEAVRARLNKRRQQHLALALLFNQGLEIDELN